MIVKFPLEVKNDVKARNLSELKENFDIVKVIGYFLNGKLQRWLELRDYEEEANAIVQIKKDDDNLARKLCGIFDVEYEEQQIGQVDTPEKVRRLETVLQLTSDEEVIKNVDHTALCQKELEILLDKCAAKIYLCGERFNIPIYTTNVSFVGVDNPEVIIESKEEVDWNKQNVSFVNVHYDDKYELVIRDAEVKRSKKIEYTQPILDNTISYIWDDIENGISFCGKSCNGSMCISVPKNSHILDIAGETSCWIAADRKGRVYTWGTGTGYYNNRGINQPEMPAVKQVLVLRRDVFAALDINGKIHIWGGSNPDLYISGSTTAFGKIKEYEEMPNNMPPIVQIAENSDVVFAIDENGKLWTWGSISSLRSVPDNIPKLQKIVPDYDWIYALTYDNTVIRWKDNNYFNNKWEEVYKNDLRIMDIAPNGGYAFALDKQGNVHSFGDIPSFDQDFASKAEELRNIRRVFKRCIFMDENGKLFHEWGAPLTDKDTEKPLQVYY